MKAIISFNNDDNPIVIENNQSFTEFIRQLFKNKIYLSTFSKESKSLAINTHQITYVWEEEE